MEERFAHAVAGLGRLRSFQQAGAELGEFRDQIGGVLTRQRGGVDLSCEQYGCGYVGAAFEAVFAGFSRQIKKFGSVAANAAP